MPIIFFLKKATRHKLVTIDPTGVEKVFEQVMYKHVYNHLITNTLIYQYQSGLDWLSSPVFKRATDEGSLPEIVQYSPYYLPLNVLTACKGSNLCILFAITAVGVVPCGGPKKSPHTSSIVQIIFLFRSFEISQDVQSVQNTHV